MSLIFRPAIAADIPTLVDTECRAFNRDSAEIRMAKAQEIERNLPGYVVLTDAGRLVATAWIQRHWLRVGSCRVLKGDVGHVAVPPELHGRGYGTELMRRVIVHVREQGFHLSRLGGLMKFHSRFGYEPFIRRYVHIRVPELDREFKGQLWRKALGVPVGLPPHVRPYHPAQDHAALHRLRYAGDATRSGQHVIEPEPSGAPTGGPDPEGLQWVYDDGAIRGFLYGSYALVNAGDAGPSYRLDELVCDPACPAAAGALVKALMQRAQDQAPTTVWCRLPYDEALLNALSEAGIACDLVEWRTTVDGNMMQVVNLEGTLAAVAPELSARLAGVPHWEGTVGLVLPGQQATLAVGRERVTRGGEGPADLTVTASQADFIKWLFGIVGFSEAPQARALPPAARAALSLIFPRLPCASGPWG